MDVLSRLRETTRDAHQHLETELDIFTRLQTPSGRRDLVQRFSHLHASAERVLAGPLDGVADLAYPQRRRTTRLSEDLSALGLSSLALRTSYLTPPRNVAEALGLLYVLEGSTLGGRIIRNRIEAQGGEMTGLTFLDPYGARTGALWRDFLRVLHREAPPSAPGAIDDTVRGGIRGFALAHRWLCKPVLAA